MGDRKGFGPDNINPGRGVKMSPEFQRERYLEPEEMGRLVAALDAHPARTAADLVKLLLLTGSRRAEAQQLRWTEIDLENGNWSKSASKVKQNRLTVIPLNDAAWSLLRDLKARAADSPWVFPYVRGDKAGPIAAHGYECNAAINRTWVDVCQAAGLSGVWIHDLRHCFASVAASNGIPLYTLGKLLGHSQVSSTARYSHIRNDALRLASQGVGAVITGSLKPSGESSGVTPAVASHIEHSDEFVAEDEDKPKRRRVKRRGRASRRDVKWEPRPLDRIPGSTLTLPRARWIRGPGRWCSVSSPASRGYGRSMKSSLRTSSKVG